MGVDIVLRSFCPCVLRCFNCVQLFATPLIVAYQAPLSMAFSRHEYLSGFPCPLSGYFPNRGIKAESLMSPALAQTVKNLPSMWETWVRSLGWEDPLEKGMAVFLPGKSHGQGGLAGYSLRDHKELDTT